MSDPTPYLFWITSRAAGTTALVLSSVSVTLGLAMATRIGRGAGASRLSLHQTLSLAVMVALAVHGLALLGDGWLHPSLLAVSIPFVSGYRTLATSLGIGAAWALVILGLSYRWRRRIGPRRWRSIHRFTVLAWLAGVIHALTEGSDAGQAWFLLLVALPTLPALAMLALRILRSPDRGASPTDRRVASPRRRPARLAGRPAAL